MSTPEASSSTSPLFPSSPGSAASKPAQSSPSPINDELKAKKDEPKGFFSQYRTVEERFKVLIAYLELPDSASTTHGNQRRTAVQRALESSGGGFSTAFLMFGLTYLVCMFAGSPIKLSSSPVEMMSELMAVAARCSSWWVNWTVESIKACIEMLEARRGFLVNVLSATTLTVIVGFFAWFAVVPPLLLVVWSVTLHELTVLKLLPVDFISPPVAYTLDHLLLLSPILLLSRYLPPILTHPVLVYPLLTLYLASAALDCTIPEVFNYPFDRFERILAEHRRLLKEQMSKSVDVEGLAEDLKGIPKELDKEASAAESDYLRRAGVQEGDEKRRGEFGSASFECLYDGREVL
ncbi:hypothetical protein BCR35DRAFT_335287 [Leucosporidium creatinivorum]|uniref:Uncharacterized protein n=1 Tax=Leucosporidium creatinivorum TaxID=106004 RepID=A0A1Y2DF21_9BASI|nr:hypothetical protein BCR35DRAFT_335287 [Leucosporidium creatinivorum]